MRLQKELFTPQDEQLLAFVHCQKVSGEKRGNKPKDIYLCIVNEASSQPGFQFNISLCEVKTSDRPQDPPRKKKTWPLRELRTVDGKWTEASKADTRDANGPSDNSFDLGLGDKVFTWSAISFEEKQRFLSTLVNLSVRRQRNQLRKVALLNLPPGVVIEDAPQNQGAADAKWAAIINKEDMADGETYQAINDREASDLLALMRNCEHAITNADIFVEDLSRQLNILDGDNIYSIMASEENIDHLMEMLETSIKHAESLESRLNQYDELMENIRDSVDKMEGKTGNFETVNLNNKKLLNLLEKVIKQLDLPYSYQQALTEVDFSQPQKLRDSIRAAQALERSLTTELEPSLLKLASVQDQRKRCERLRDKFSKSVCRHLNNVFVSLGNESENRLDLSASGQTAAVGELQLTRRRNIHKELIRFAELVHWMKTMDPKNFNALQSTYRTSLCKLYDKDIKKFFENARFKISGNKLLSAPTSGSSQDLSGGKKVTAKYGAASPGGLLGNDTDSLGSEISTSERERFDDVTETILLEFEAICRDEQSFSIQFFKMATKSPSAKPDPKKDKILMEEARSMMAEIFPSLESELLQFVSAYEKLDSFFTMNALVRLSKHVLSAQDTGSFLAISLGTVLVQVKRNFDKFMQLQLRSIEEAKAPRRSKCAILPFIQNFEKFVETTESIFRNSERRSDLEKWYSILVTEMMVSITRLSREHSKTPSEVVKMENFHHLFALLSRMKISSLDNLRKDSKQKYSDALRAYVTQYFGRPLEKLTQFFDGIQQRLNAGIKESEIGYQLDFSKQELRKVIAIYPGREVKKGLDNLYKKVERHLCEEENLIQVVWRSMQEEFITQYKCIEDLIQRCYPGSQISLDFSIEDVLQYFSDIARSH